MRARRITLASRGVVLALLLLAVLLGGAMSARADGDPASDYLLVQSTFLSPFDGHVASAQSSQLIQMVSEAQKQGLPLKVAVIVTPYDLGSVPILFDKAETYAKFLGQEDFYYWKDELLVVMPSGYGLFRSTGTPVADVAAIRRLRFVPTKSGTALVVDAQRAVRVLAARHGIALSSASGGGSSGGSTSGQERTQIGGAVLAVLLAAVGVRVARRRRGRAPR